MVNEVMTTSNLMIITSSLSSSTEYAMMTSHKSNDGIVVSYPNELLRYDSPVQLTSRSANQDLELGGKHISVKFIFKK